MPKHKFSLWCDFVESEFLNGEFAALINGKVCGATSNPAIFKQAITTSPIYKAKIANFSGCAKAKYEFLAIADIQKAADKLAPHFARGEDGFVSLEIDPRLSDNGALSIGEAKRLFTAIGRENVMMKIPATEASYEAMEVLVSEGVSVNATLIFSPCQTKKCFEALNAGLRKFRKRNEVPIKRGLREPQAVISIFVSRFDRLLNSRVIDKNSIGVLNATLCYDFIAAQNEPNIRALFASTGVKGDDLAQDFYINELLFANAVNTAPLNALRAFNSENFSLKKPLSMSEIRAKLNANLSEDELNSAYKILLDDGLKQFCVAFEEILKAV